MHRTLLSTFIIDVPSDTQEAVTNFWADDLDAEVDRLKGLGATMVDDSFVDHPGKWVIMADPAGKEFCVVCALNPLRPQADRDAFERKSKPVG
ncbi:VOC family protein [Mycolicibacterium lutetiense]|uniref:Glyoxalase-like domain-containing protein n=1 Tax=Mycolicibacterium lutetiense TaxID=1641992 RepID=A0ABS4ZNF3_9MYCO|nr:VOC family protein [Mycolicibacterium lutetiense]MBP2451032.1 hypothetical protein [Mycolicibacterium lutetiense]